MSHTLLFSASDAKVPECKRNIMVVIDRHVGAVSEDVAIFIYEEHRGIGTSLVDAK